VIVARPAARGRLGGRGATAAVDATGLEARHVSAHYGYRYSARYRAAYAGLHRGAKPRRRHRRPRHPKLAVVVHTASHLIVAAVPGVGPAADAGVFAPLVRQAAALVAFGALVADAGFDAEAAHALCRRTLGIRRTAIRLNPRTAGRRWPRTRYRREMRRAFPWRLYHRRQQVESVFSRDKRRLGAALTARRPAHQLEEQVLRVLTHNLMLLHRGVRRFQQSHCHSE
jgi:DDE family transposase